MRFVGGGADPVVDGASALLAYLMPVLRDTCPAADDQPLEIPGFPEWVADPVVLPGFRRYSARPRFFSAESQCALRVLGELREAGTKVIADLEDAMQADDVIGPRIRGDSVISHAVGGGAWQPETVVLALVEHAVEKSDGFELAPADVDRIAAEWTDTLRREADRVSLVTALGEFETSALGEFETSVASFELEPFLEIAELSEAEVAAALLIGGGTRGLAVDERTVAKAFGIRTTFESQLFINETPPADVVHEQKVREEAERTVRSVLLALRVFKPGRVSATGEFQYVTEPSGETRLVAGSVSPAFGWHAAQPYVLASDDVEPFREFWREFKAASNHAVLANTLRRFSYAAERTLPEDEIVDLMIAAESFFLSGMGRERAELGFRLSTRVASLLGSTVAERMRLWRFMRAAYGARSVIVHGLAPREKDLRNLDGEQVRIHVFADELEDVLRRAIRIAIRRVAAGEPFPPDWEELLFAGG